jgi:DNA-binding CsgD family transcriptional regulator
MIKVLSYLVFILTVAFTTAGISLGARLRNRNRTEFFSHIIYFQIFIFTFGFYGIWGHVFIKTFLSSYISPDLLVRFSNIAMLMGLPFLVFAWLMLIQFSYSVSGRKTGKWTIFWFLFGNFSILFIIGYIIASRNITEPSKFIRNYFILMNIVWTLLASYLIHLPIRGREIVHEHDRRIISPVISVIATIQCIPLFFYEQQPWFGLLFIVLFFLGNTFLPVYFSYGTFVSAPSADRQDVPSFADFCKRFDVSPRESDIIREICNGLSNKEISNKLFISLQTVKDHTHRIYIKTNVKSRVQLINLVKEELSK